MATNTIIMAKYHDQNLLQKLKEWVHDEARRPLYHLAAELNYADLNKFGAKLLEIDDSDPQLTRGLIEAKAEEVALKKNGISKNCFRTVARFVFEVDDEQPLSLPVHLLTHDDLWAGLKQLEVSIAGTEDFTTNLKDLGQAFQAKRSVLNKMNLESVLIAGMVVFLCRLSEESQEDNLTESVCMPVLEALGLPSSKSSVTRYGQAFDAFIEAFWKPTDEEPFTEGWFSWWRDFQFTVREACWSNPQLFAPCVAELKSFPGARQALLELPEEAVPQNSTNPSKPKDVDPIQVKVEKYRSLKPPAQKKMALRSLDKALTELGFIERAMQDSDELKDSLSRIQRLRDGLGERAS